MHLFVVGLNHTTAALAVREQVATPSHQVEQTLTEALDWFARAHPSQPIHEIALLSTCNRTELYVATNNAHSTEWVTHILIDFLVHHYRISQEALRPHLYILTQESVMRHAFQVASGLDSMVLGEPQILGQMKQAAQQAAQAKSLGTHLHHLFQSAFSVAKEVRSTTEIGAHSISMAAATVRLAQRIFENISEQNVLLIGTGEMIELCATHFAARNPQTLAIANRTLIHAEILAHRFQARAHKLASLSDYLAQYDIVISCTASSLPIIGLGLIERVIKQRRHKPMFMVDLAVPRDIEPEIGALDDVFLYTIDDLGEVIQMGVTHRQAAVTQANAIIDRHVQLFLHWQNSRAVVPFIQNLQAASENVRLHELARAKKMLAKGGNVEEILEALSKNITAKFLHEPQHMLHQTEGEERDRLITLFSQLFNVQSH